MHMKGIIFTVLSAVLFGITPILASLLYAYGASSITVVFFRSFFALPILFVIMKLKKVSLYIEKRNLFHTCVIALFGSGLTTILLFTSYQYIDVGSATTLHFLYPLCVSILCYFLYHEALDKTKWFALAIAVIGTLCFINFTHMDNMIGLLLASLSAITYAFYMVQLSKKQLTKQNPYLISFYMAFFTMIETMLFQIFQPSITFEFPLNAYLLFVVLSVVSSFLAVVLLQLGIRELGPSTASIFCLFEPITSIIMGAIFLHETISILKIIGSFIILSSLVIITMAEKKKNASRERDALPKL